MLNLFLIKRWLFSSITPIGISLVKMELRVFEAINVKIVNIIWGLPRRKGSFVITVARDQLLDLYRDSGWGERSGEIFWVGLENCFFCNAGLSFYLWFYAKCTCKQHLPSSLLFISGKINDCHSEYKITSLPGVKSITTYNHTISKDSDLPLFRVSHLGILTLILWTLKKPTDLAQ